MAGTTGEDYGLESGSSSVEGMSSGQGCQAGDSRGDWRSSEQVENGTPSTSPTYTDDDADFGPKPANLYGRFTWKIDKFSQISKRELRSNVFEVGGYKWYILIYPQGCDVCNHLSLFLCVANHDKLLPGWSHFAQFTIAVVNKDSKKSKHSDTLHRFWKKEHDWGWKKFMELSKLSDGFIVADALVIKAQVQVIRENSHQPFRCLDCQYRRELVRVYLSNVEQLCRRYVEEKRGKFSKLIEDKVRWSSFHSFWLGVDQNARRWMSRDKTEAILKVVVKHFFIEKEVTSTLVMDSLYSGLKAIESQNKFNKGISKLLDRDEMSAPFVYVEKDLFVLTDDVLLLLERAALGPILPKDEKGLQNQNQNRTKDSSSGEEFTKDSIERDERRLTELGRRTLEIFVLNHIFSRIEVAYQEAVALKRQEELIREEEAAGQAENELKSKRNASEKEKRTKRKQAKQKRNSRKGKERIQDEKCETIVLEKSQEENSSSERILEELSENLASSVLENVGDVSDLSDTVDDVSEVLQPDLDETDTSPINWDVDALEINPATEAGSSETQNDQAEKKNQSVMDDSSSTCSTDSIPSVGMIGPNKRNALSNNKSSSSRCRVKSQQSRNSHDRTSQAYGDATNKLQSDYTADASHPREVTVNCKATAAESKAVVSLRDSTQRLEQHLVEKEEVVTVQKKASIKDQVDEDRSSKPRIVEQSSSTSPVKNPSLQQPNWTSESSIAAAEPVSIREPSSNSESQAEKLISVMSRSTLSSKPEAKPIIPTKIAAHQASAVTRPPSAPLIPGPRPTVPLVSTTQAAPLLSRSVSAAGRLGTDASSSTHSHVPQSYRNAIMCKTTMGANTPNFAHPSLSSASHTSAYSQSLPSFILSSSAPQLNKSARVDHASVRPGLTFGSVNPESLQTQHQWMEEPLQLEATSSMLHNAGLLSDIRRLDIRGTQPHSFYFDEGTNMRQALGVTQDEFPHLDIINDLLDEEQNVGKFVPNEYHQQHHHPTLNRQYTFPGDIATAADVGTSNCSSYFDQMGQYYDDGIQRVYGASDVHFNRRRDLASEQLDVSPYGNGQLEAVCQNRWPIGSMDHSILGLGSAEADPYAYRLPDSSNLASGLNGYAMYRHANGF